ncbi:BQ2448_5414 [Microbotryum intermedium]|uniref:BQ2448_5414 protein n=1 Tax=Microbotryum intermedium TaxID=269621 RepID=A0A238F713_9BASI|nr:BQ2448_5414 [Microbotryum intermedium]
MTTAGFAADSGSRKETRSSTPDPKHTVPPRPKVDECTTQLNHSKHRDPKEDHACLCCIYDCNKYNPTNDTEYEECYLNACSGGRCYKLTPPTPSTGH